MTCPTEVARNNRPFLHGPEAIAVYDVLTSGHYGHTDVSDLFEQRVAAYLGVPAVVAVSSGTAALHLALHAAGVNNREVLVPSMTYCATVQAILAAGARPRFLEIDPATSASPPSTSLTRSRRRPGQWCPCCTAAAPWI